MSLKKTRKLSFTITVSAENDRDLNALVRQVADEVEDMPGWMSRTISFDGRDFAIQTGIASLGIRQKGFDARVEWLTAAVTKRGRPWAEALVKLERLNERGLELVDEMKAAGVVGETTYRKDVNWKRLLTAVLEAQDD